jgi:uncharacterized protein YidB (DUF937 family)
MSGLEDLLKGLQGGGGGGGGLGGALSGALGGGGGGGALSGGLGGILGSMLGGGAGGGLMKMLMPTVMGMLAGGGLSKILGGMKAHGLSSQADSWVGTGENKPISADDVKGVVDPAQISELARKLGVSEDDAAQALAEVLPHAVDHVTPAGTVPAAHEVDSALDRLKSLL